VTRQDAIALALVAVFGCGGGGSVTSPTQAGPQAKLKPPFDTVDFMLSNGEFYSWDGTAWATLPTYRVGPDRWVECKFGDCSHHEAFRYDGEWVYLDEDHSMNDGATWFVYSLGRWAKRRWQPGDSFDVQHFSSWFQSGICRRNIEGHEILYRVRFEALWEDFDFRGDLGVRDAIVVSYSPTLPQYRSGVPPDYSRPEYNVYARGAGRVYWGYGRPGPDSAFANRRVWGQVSHPSLARTCAWR